MSETQPKLRWYLFTLRRLLVLVLLASIGFSWLGVSLHRARRQHQAAAAVSRLGGRIGYDSAIVYDRWTLKVFGVDFWSDVEAVFFSWHARHEFGDDDIPLLRRFSALESLNLCNTRVTDRGLEELAQLKNLKRLSLEGTQVTDAGLEHLKGLTGLRDLELRRTQVTADGVKRLEQALPACRIHGGDYYEPLLPGQVEGYDASPAS